MSHAHAATGAILIGGESRRMGRDKADLELAGQTLVECVYLRLRPLVREILLVVRPERRDWAAALAPDGARVVTDQVPARGPLAGIHAALSAATFERVLVVACDMPQLHPPLLNALLADETADVVIPRTGHGFEPLLAVYGKTCLPAIERSLAAGPCRVPTFFPDVTVTAWNEDRLRKLDPGLRSLVNVNRPQDLSPPSS